MAALTKPAAREERAGAASGAGEGWLTTPERGTRAGIRFVLGLCRIFGRGGARAFLRPLVFYYAVFAGGARRAAQIYQGRLRGVDARAIGFWEAYRQLLRFAEVALDRVFLVRGETSGMQFTFNGIEHLERLRAQGRGAILLGAHLGSFEAMRQLGGAQAFTINILAYFENARQITDFLAEAGADFNGRVIAIEPSNPSYILAVQEAIDAGELVAVLGDRVGLNEKTTTVDFLGAKARLPVGPYTMAAVLRCPIFLTFGLYSPPSRYDLYCEPLCERFEAPRGAREAAIAALAQAYAARLEHYCRLAPENWFNFYDFWGDHDEG